MGKSLINFYRNKVKLQWKLAFTSTFIIGLLVHMYKFTNTLLNHDSVYNFYSNQNMVGSGRWFLSVACGISSFWDLPWINGLLSVIYIALTVVVIVALFKIENPVVIILTGGLVSTFPAVTETLFYGFTADGYMLAMLFASLAVYFSTFERKEIKYTLLSIVLVSLCCGIYQAYVSFGLLLMFFYFINEVFENRRTNKDCFKYIARQACIYLFGLILYYVMWKVCMHFQNVNATSYQGINEVSDLSGFSFSLAWLIDGFKTCIKTILKVGFEIRVVGGKLSFKEVTLYGALNIALMAVLVVSLIFIAFKSKLYKRKLQMFFVIGALFLCIPAAGMWIFASEKVWYSSRMMQSLVLILVFAAILFDRWFNVKLSSIFGLLLAVIVFHNSIIANISYYYMNKEKEQSYAMGTEITMRVHEIDGEEKFEKIAIVGSRWHDVTIRNFDRAAEDARILTRFIERDILHDYIHTMLYLQGVFEFENYQFASESECDELKENEEVKEMEKWPSAKSMKVIDDILVIKLS